MIGSTFKTIPITREPGSEIFNGFRMGEIDQETWILFSAVRMAEKAHEKIPRPYQPMPQGLRQYCKNRVIGAIDYDRSIAVRLGEWFEHIQRNNEENRTHIDDLIWARERMLNAKPTQTRLAKACEEAMDRFYNNSFPGEDVRLAVQTKKADSRDRERSGR